MDRRGKGKDQECLSPQPEQEQELEFYQAGERWPLLALLRKHVSAPWQDEREPDHRQVCA